MTGGTARAVFLHVPKTAGTSVHVWLARQLGDAALSERFDATPLSPERARTLGAARIVSGHVSWNDAQRYFADRDVFTFLRDPIERGLSWLRFARSLPPSATPPRHADEFRNDPDQAVALAHALTPVELVLLGHPHVEQNLHDRMTHQLAGEAVLERRGESAPGLVEDALEHLAAMCHVGFADRLASDLHALARALRLPPFDGVVPHENATRAGADADDELRTVLADRMPLDLALYERARDRYA